MNVCLRCDWRGATNDDGCPRCAAPLFRSSAGAPRRAGLPAPDVRPGDASRDAGAPTAPPPDPGILLPVERDDPGPSRWRRAAGGLPVLALGLVIALVTVMTSGRPDPAGGGSTSSVAPDVLPATELSGSLVYSRYTPSAERIQLWRWDLERNEVEAGPIVPKPLQLVSASAVAPGTVGLTWRRDDGALQAALLRSLDVGADPEPLLAGDLVAWSPRGVRVSASSGPRASPCPGPVAVRATRLAPRFREPTFRTRTCGDVLSLAADAAVTYFTLEVGERVHVAYGGIREPTIVLRDHALLSVSWAGDMIVQEMRPPAPTVPLGREPSAERASTPVPGGLSYFNRKTTEPDPVPIAFASADEPFMLRSLLAWAPSSFEVLAHGAFGGRRGIFRLDTLPSDGIDPPAWVMEASGPTSATYTREGVAIVLTDGAVFALVDDDVHLVPMPIGAPLADGRVAWIP